ncbi:glutamate synthase [NADH] [Emmonsiellopsis sp. PD_33]|nr:glutamate synthase [NADH] [Emmonsiellopsis sp. PD_33]
MIRNIPTPSKVCYPTNFNGLSIQGSLESSSNPEPQELQEIKIEQWRTEQQQPNITGDDNLVIPFESIMLRQPGQVMPAPPESDEPAAMAAISTDELVNAWLRLSTYEEKVAAIKKLAFSKTPVTRAGYRPGAVRILSSARVGHITVIKTSLPLTAGKVVDWVNRGSADFADDLDSVAEAIQCQLKRRGNRGAEDIPSNQSAEQAQLAYQILMSDHYHMLDPYAVRDGDRISGTVTQVKNHCSKEAKCDHIKLYRAPLVTKPSTSTSASCLPVDPYFLGLWLGDGAKRITLVGVVLSNGYVLAWFKRMLPSLWPRPGGAVDPQNKAEIGQSEDVLGSPESTQSTPALLIAVAEAPEPKSDCVVDVIVGGIRGERRLVPICSIGSGRAGFPVSAPHYTTWKFVYDESDGDKEGLEQEADQDARGDNRYLVYIKQKFSQIGYEARIDGYFGDI